MKLDLVHDIQRAYRNVVDAMSKPGLISNIKAQADKIDLGIDCFKSTAVLVLMLFDTEITFKVFSDREANFTKLINQLTYAKAVEAQYADFILVLNDVMPSDLEVAFKKANPGDLKNPHESATIIIEADTLNNDRNLVLTGPGIDGENYISVQGVANWVELRAERNSEYPLGIDLIFTDLSDNILGIPRTTQIEKRVVG